ARHAPSNGYLRPDVSTLGGSFLQVTAQTVSYWTRLHCQATQVTKTGVGHPETTWCGLKSDGCTHRAHWRFERGWFRLVLEGTRRQTGSQSETQPGDRRPGRGAHPRPGGA